MSKKVLYTDGDSIAVAVPSGTLSGDPIVFGVLPGVAQVDRDADGEATCWFKGVHLLSVRGWDGTANAVIAAGAKIYFTVTDTPKLNVRVAGVGFGVAMAGVGSGLTVEIPVRVTPGI